MERNQKIKFAIFLHKILEFLFKKFFLPNSSPMQISSPSIYNSSLGEPPGSGWEVRAENVHF